MFMSLLLRAAAVVVAFDTFGVFIKKQFVFITKTIIKLLDINIIIQLNLGWLINGIVETPALWSACKMYKFLITKLIQHRQGTQVALCVF